MLSPQSLWRCLDPYPAALLRCPLELEPPLLQCVVRKLKIGRLGALLDSLSPFAHKLTGGRQNVVSCDELSAAHAWAALN